MKDFEVRPEKQRRDYAHLPMKIGGSVLLLSVLALSACQPTTGDVALAPSADTVSAE